jgi:hypothetical protein
VKIVLSTVAEIVGELGGDSLQRRADAIELVERLLLDSRLTPSRYHAFVGACTGAIREELASVHAAVAGGVPSFDQRIVDAATKAQQENPPNGGKKRSRTK